MRDNFDKIPRIPKSMFGDDDDLELTGSNKATNNKNKKSNTPVLDTYSTDLTRMVEEGKLDRVIGRDTEVSRISQILCRKKKNNPIVIGDPGTGKTSLVDALAQRIYDKKVPRALFDKRVVLLDLPAMVAGTKFRGQFEERIKAVINEVIKSGDVILFIDEVHTIIGTGGSTGSMDASNILKPALSRGELQIIGATTIDEYRKHIEKDSALDRRFQRVMVNEPTKEECYEILEQVKSVYEDHHNVIFTKDAIKACVDLTSRYVTDRFLPDKAFDALDEAGSMVNITTVEVPKEIKDIEFQIQECIEKKKTAVLQQAYEDAASLRDEETKLKAKLEVENKIWKDSLLNNKKTVTDEDIAKVVSTMTGIPITKMNTEENKKLNNMFEELSSKVIGQDEAISRLTKVIQRGRVGMKDPNKPLGSSIMVGSSGVGKTLLAKQLAKYLFGSEDALLRLDMSEFMEKISVNRIIGAPSGYVGYEDSNFLDKVRRKPYSVILFDEIEKAHADIHNLFLQILDEGMATDSHGRKVDFKNCVILMTSNVGTKTLRDFGGGIGFTKNVNNAKHVLDTELKKKFPAEFINRIDEIIYFNDLKTEDIGKIVDIEMIKSVKRAKSIGFDLDITNELKEHIVEAGHDLKYGARPVKRAINKWIDNYITEFIIENEPEEGKTLKLDYDKEGDKTVVSIKKPKK